MKNFRVSDIQAMPPEDRIFIFKDGILKSKHGIFKPKMEYLSLKEEY